MSCYKLTIEYDGAPFCGWQIQADQPTVQAVLTMAVEALTGEQVLAAMRKYLDLSKMTIVKAGDFAKGAAAPAPAR